MQHIASRRLEEHAERTRDGVVHREEVDHEIADLHLVARIDLAQLRLDAMLLEFTLDKAERHLRAVNRNLLGEVLHEVRQAARMVFVAVGNDDAAKLVLILEYIRVVGKNEVDARMVIVGKHEAGVIENHVVAALDDGHVLANAVEAAKRNDFQRHIGVVLHRTARIVARTRLARARFVERFGLKLRARRKLRALMLERDMLGARRGTTAISVRSLR